jgi:GNAT superfamily N-acetyltransferase
VSLAIETRRGGDAAPWMPAVAALRIEVFREWPYLYDGSLAYEQEYLAPYLACPASAIVVARDGDRIVGAATALPLEAHGEEVAPPLAAAGYAPRDVFYLGESVLARGHRGLGIGHRFFDEREAAARASGYAITAFCAVERDPADPRRPADHVPHDAFWHKRGYVRRPDIRTTFAWRDLGDAEETSKPMVFWIREAA